MPGSRGETALLASKRSQYHLRNTDLSILSYVARIMTKLNQSIPAVPYIVCFFDLLSQRKKLNEANCFPSNPEETKQLKETWIDIISTLNSFRESFDEGLKYAREAISRELPWHTREMNEIITELSVMNVKSQMFSDSVILFAPISQERPAKAAVDIQNLLITCCIIFGVGISEGLIYRGGIEAGPGAEIFEDDDGVYGPVLSHAYDLESEVAKYPRIAVGGQLIQFLDHLVSESGEEVEGRIVRGAAKLSSELIARDSDEVLILDYCGKAMAELDRNIEEEVIVPALEFARGELQRFRDAGDEGLEGKYELLVKYLESRRSGDSTRGLAI
jgi:hypothetical protein